MKLYNISRPKKIINLVHIDCYRLKKPDELIDIGVLEYIDQKDTVVVIEWADKVKKILPKKAVKINIKLKKGSQREIIIS